MLADHMRPIFQKMPRRPKLRFLLRQAKLLGLVTQAELDLFDRLREMRNPYGHYQRPPNEKRIAARALRSATSIAHIVLDDARQAVLALIDLCARPPFGEPLL
jgi:hypothetical protein